MRPAGAGMACVLEIGFLHVAEATPPIVGPAGIESPVCRAAIPVVIYQQKGYAVQAGEQDKSRWPRSALRKSSEARREPW